MSKKGELPSVPLEYTGWGNTHLLFEDSVSRMVGRVLTHVESWGMPTAQEKAVKSLVKKEIYSVLDEGWIIGDSDHAMLRKKAYEFGQLSMGGHHPSEFPSAGNSYSSTPSVE